MTNTITTRLEGFFRASTRRRCSMSMNNGQWTMSGGQLRSGRRIGLLLISVFCLLTLGCGVRFDMQDQPRYKKYKKSDFFKDGKAMRDLPEGTVARGLLKENKAFYTGKIDNPNPNVQVQTTTDA